MDIEVAAIWQQVQNGLRVFIAKRVRSENDTDDILQEVFLRVHQHLGRLEEPDRVVAWVFQITRNVIVDYYRSIERRRELPVGLAGNMDDHGLPNGVKEAPSEGAREELSGCLRPMVERLSSEYREAIKLVELDGLTHRQAAIRLGLSVSGMKSRVQRGRRQLKKLLEDCCLIELDSRRSVSGYELRQEGGPLCQE